MGLCLKILKCVYWGLTSLCAQKGNIETKRKPEVRLCPTLFEMLLDSVQYHRHHITLQAFTQFGALHMDNHDEKYLVRPGFKPGTSRLRATAEQAIGAGKNI